MRNLVPPKPSLFAMKRLAMFAEAASGMESLRTMEPQPFENLEVTLVLSGTGVMSFPTFVQSAEAACAAPRVSAATAAVKSKRFMCLCSFRALES